MEVSSSDPPPSETPNESKNAVSDVSKAENGSSKAGDGNKRKPNRRRKRQWEFNLRDDAAQRPRPNPEDRVKRRKYIVVLGYAGARYLGMQRNPDVNTIEEELLKAMLKHKWITEEGFEQPQFVHFQRAARTDKGVSAARQVISLKIPEQLDVAALNKDLPSDIKVFGVKRVTNNFNCKDQCDGRTYSYTLPSISFAPSNQTVDMKTFRLDDATLARVNETLQLFIGTKNFHNFTSRKRFEEASARRYITDFRCEPPFMVDDVEFCTIIVRGQSFMMHQIRKMIGLTLAVVRGVTVVETIPKSFESNRLDIPMAPGLGLVLDQVHYVQYNARFKGDGVHEQLEWDEFETEIQEFRDKFIHPVIKETEIKEQPMVKWLETLTLHSYDVRAEEVANNEENMAKKSTNGKKNENEQKIENENGTGQGMDDGAQLTKNEEMESMADANQEISTQNKTEKID